MTEEKIVRYKQPHGDLGSGYGLKLGPQARTIYLYLLENGVGRDASKSISELAEALPEISSRFVDPLNINAAVKTLWEKLPICRYRREGSKEYAYYVEADLTLMTADLKLVFGD